MSPTPSPELIRLNAAPRDAALALMEPMAERSAWVAEAAVDARPFASDADVAEALIEAILAVPAPRRVAMFRAHPELAGREAALGRMTDASTGEQGRLGLLDLSAEDRARLARLNAAYQARFGYPFILALHRAESLESVFAAFEARLRADPVEEKITALAEIASVIRARTARAFGAPCAESASSPAAFPAVDPQEMSQ